MPRRSHSEHAFIIASIDIKSRHSDWYFSPILSHSIDRTLAIKVYTSCRGYKIATGCLLSCFLIPPILSLHGGSTATQGERVPPQQCKNLAHLTDAGAAALSRKEARLAPGKRGAHAARCSPSSLFAHASLALLSPVANFKGVCLIANRYFLASRQMAPQVSLASHPWRWILFSGVSGGSSDCLRFRYCCAIDRHGM